MTHRYTACCLFLLGCAAVPQAPLPTSAATLTVSPPATRATAPSSVEPTLLSDVQKRRDASAAPRVETILAAFSNLAPVLSADGKQVLFRSDRDGTSQLYIADVAHPEAPARALTQGPERVASARFSLDGKQVLFRRDFGADENFHIFRIALDGSGLTDLTPQDPHWRDHPQLAPGDVDRLVYSQRKPDDYRSEIVIQSLAQGTTRIAYTDAAPGTLVDLSHDGKRGLFMREAASGHELLEVDLETGGARQLAPLDGKPAQISAAAYASDQKRVYIATDQGTETYRLLAVEPTTLKTLAEYRQTGPDSAALGAVVPSPRGDRVALLVNAGNHSLVRMLDARTLAVQGDVQTELGTVSIGTTNEVQIPVPTGSFSADGRQFVLSLSLPARPDDIYLANSKTRALTPLRKDARTGLAELAPIRASIELVPAFDGLSIPVNVYLPAELETGRKLPTLVMLHGGPDQATAFSWDAWNRVFTSFGFAVLEPNIRGSKGFGRAYELADDREKRLDALRDLASVNQWARDQPWCDGERLVVQGGSFGGYYVLMALTRQPELWAAGVDLAGVTDLTLLAGPGAAKRYLSELGDPERDHALLAALSPLKDADKVRAPLFIYQGENDGHVPRAHPDAFVRALRTHGIAVEYMLARNEGHTVARHENQVEFLTRELRFLHDALHLAGPGVQLP